MLSSLKAFFGGISRGVWIIVAILIALITLYFVYMGSVHRFIGVRYHAHPVLFWFSVAAVIVAVILFFTELIPDKFYLSYILAAVCAFFIFIFFLSPNFVTKILRQKKVVTQETVTTASSDSTTTTTTTKAADEQNDAATDEEKVEETNQPDSPPVSNSDPALLEKTIAQKEREANEKQRKHETDSIEAMSCSRAKKLADLQRKIAWYDNNPVKGCDELLKQVGTKNTVPGNVLKPKSKGVRVNGSKGTGDNLSSSDPQPHKEG